MADDPRAFQRILRTMEDKQTQTYKQVDKGDEWTKAGFSHSERNNANSTYADSRVTGAHLLAPHQFCFFEARDGLRIHFSKDCKIRGNEGEGSRIICKDCHLEPRLDEGDDPFKLHAELTPDCAFVIKYKEMSKISEEAPAETATTRRSNIEGTECMPTCFIEFPSILSNTFQSSAPAEIGKSTTDQETEKEDVSHADTTEQLLGCWVCRNEVSSVLFLPCRHIYACEKCAGNERECKKCGTHILEKEMVYRC